MCPGTFCEKSFQITYSTSKCCFHVRFLPMFFLSMNRDGHLCCLTVYFKTICRYKHLIRFQNCPFQFMPHRRDHRGLCSHGKHSPPLGELEILCVDDWLGSTHTDIHAGAGLPLRFYKPRQFFINGYPQGLLRTSA